MASFSLLAGIASLLTFAKGDVICDEQYSCRSGSYTCDQPNGCLISCEGEESCQDSTFTCTNSCEVHCFDTASCVDSTFIFLNEQSVQHCKGSNSCTDGTFRTYNDTILTLTCDGENACDDGRIECYELSTFGVECSGPDACQLLSCTCSADECEIAGDLECADTLKNLTKKQIDATKKGKNVLKDSKPKLANENGFKPKIPKVPHLKKFGI